VTGNSTDFTVPGDTDFREGFSIQLSRSREEASDPSRAMMRQIAGSFEQYEKARLVRKLHEARDRKIAAGQLRP
jgi:hypothetical protein